MVRLVAVERNVFQPRVQRLEGAEAVLQHLKRSADSPSLASAASALMRSSRADDERAFDAVDGEWVPGDLAARESTRPSAAPGGAGDVAELRAELLVMRASHERLRERLQRLEAQMQNGRRSHDVLSIPPTPTFVMPSASDAPQPAQPYAPPSVPVGPAATRISGAGSVPPNAMTLPTVDAISRTLQSLIGEPGTVREHRPLSFAPSALGPCWVSRLIDDEGHEVGAIVADRAATLSLGGALIGLPPHELEEQRGLAAPSEDVVSAMSEVSNNLCEAVNQEPGGCQVRVKPIEPLSPSMLGWVDAGRGLELELSSGAGRLFLFAR